MCNVVPAYIKCEITSARKYKKKKKEKKKVDGLEFNGRMVMVGKKKGLQLRVQLKRPYGELINT